MNSRKSLKNTYSPSTCSKIPDHGFDLKDLSSINLNAHTYYQLVKMQAS